MQNRGQHNKIMLMNNVYAIFKRLTLLREPLKYPIRQRDKIRLNQHQPQRRVSR